MTIYIEVGGVPVTAKDVVWIQRAPCGCMSGVTVRNAHATESEMILTPEGASAAFNDGIKVLIARDAEDGFTHEAMLWEQYLAESDQFKLGCSHTPKWGRPTVTVPEGMRWATTDNWYARRTFTRHLVGSECTDDDGKPKWPPQYMPALCGYTPKSKTWRAEKGDLSDTVTCRKCEAKVQPVLELASSDSHRTGPEKP